MGPFSLHKCINKIYNYHNHYFELLIIIMPTFLRSIPWGHQHLQFFEHTCFELVTLNLQLHGYEIQHWFTSHLLHLNNDTLQHRARHDSRISGLRPVSVSLLPPSRHLRSLLKTRLSVLYLYPSRPSWTHVDLCHAWNLLYQFELSIPCSIFFFLLLLVTYI